MACRPSWRQVRTSKSSSSVPGPPGSATIASAFMNMTFLRSCMVSVTTASARWRPRGLARDEVRRDDAERAAAGGGGRARDRAHQPDVAGAVDQAKAGGRERAAELVGGVGVGGVGAGAGAAEDADRPAGGKLHRQAPDFSGLCGAAVL